MYIKKYVADIITNNTLYKTITSDKTNIENCENIINPPTLIDSRDAMHGKGGTYKYLKYKTKYLESS